MLLQSLVSGAYLVSNIPLPDLKRSDDDELLGYGLQRDLSEYDEYYPSGFEIEVEII